MEFSASTLEVQLECYEGPLAVLISLIKRNKISIWDIPVSLITEKFLEYVEMVQSLHLRIAEDFIDMASLLIYIKSKLLLPSNGTGEEEADPREELVERILEYEHIKAMMANIDALPVLERDTFGGGTKHIEGEEEFDLMTLCSIFFDILKNQGDVYIQIKELKPTLEEKIYFLRAELTRSGLYTWNYTEVIDSIEKVTFILAMLELVKTRFARVTQRRPFGAITVRLRDGNTLAGNDLPAESQWFQGPPQSEPVVS